MFVAKKSFTMLYFFNVKMSLQILVADGIFYTFHIVIPHFLFNYQVKINEHPIK